MSDPETGGVGRDETVVDPDDYDETIRSECPDCGQSGDVPAEWEGLIIECKECGERMTVGETDTEVGP